VAVVNDDAMADLHKRYLGIAGPTDVLSFDLSDAPGGGTVDGQVVVSEDTARREARRRGLLFEQELLRYVIHGALHLLGHSDNTPAHAATMHRIEDELLGLHGSVAPPKVRPPVRARATCRSPLRTDAASRLRTRSPGRRRASLAKAARRGG
jgi:probable rRNA maturation factor